MPPPSHTTFTDASYGGDMTQETPPGWYPDPGQTSDGPATERWWDGKAWTDRIRPAGGPPEQPPTDGAQQAADPEGPADSADSAVSAGSAGSAGSADATGSAGLAKPAVAGDSVAGQPDAAASAPAPAPAPGEPTPEEPASAGPGTGQPPVAGPVPGYPAPPAYAAYPLHPGYPAQPPPPRRSGLRTGIAVAVTAAVLASIGVGVYALAGDGDGSGDDRAVSQQQSPGGQDGEGLPDNPFGGSGGGSGGGESPAPQGSEAPRIESGSVPDAVSGISLPVPDGWYGQELTVGAQVSSNESYECPGNSASSCTKGGAYSAPAMVLGTEGSTAEEVAKADISANAEESYGGDSYGSITSHDVLSSKAVTVAGQKGYQVRWKAVTSKGSDGYVQSLAFPSPANPQQIVVVRFGVDVSEEQSVIDKIVEGIEVSTSGGTGSGQDV